MDFTVACLRAFLMVNPRRWGLACFTRGAEAIALSQSPICDQEYHFSGIKGFRHVLLIARRARDVRCRICRSCPGRNPMLLSCATFPSSQRRGGATAARLKRGVVSLAKTFRRASIEASPCRTRASRHPVCACASLGASTPPLRGGECGENKPLFLRVVPVV